MKTNDILYANLGWSAGIPTWYRVIKHTEKSVWLQELRKRIVSDDGYGQNGTAMPCLNEFANSRVIMRRIANSQRGYQYVSINNYCTAHIWDGQPKQFYTD